MQLKLSKKILILAYIVTFTMACSLVSGIGDRFSETKEKARLWKTSRPPRLQARACPWRESMNS